MNWLLRLDLPTKWTNSYLFSIILSLQGLFSCLNIESKGEIVIKDYKIRIIYKLFTHSRTDYERPSHERILFFNHINRTFLSDKQIITR